MLRISVILALCLSFTVMTAQDSGSSTGDDYTSGKNSYKPNRLKPRLGLGVGTLMFYGEMGSLSESYSPMNSNMAYSIRAINDVTSYLEVEVSSMFGAITVNEYTTNRRQNFKSEIRTLGAAVRYNFGNFLPARRGIEPWVSVGIQGFEFLSKTDLRDSEGNFYHYWNDGTIRNLPENHENASDAQIIHRDYIYETDLRDMDLDGLGKYTDRSWGIPVGAGVQWRLTERFRVNAGAEMNFTFTDNIDNMSSSGEGVRLGDADNDRFLFTSVGINYDLNITKPFEFEEGPVPVLDENGEWVMVTIDYDGDKDGVNDFIDKCLNTPEGVAVDENGCPIDKDGDGIPDYMDDEPHSPTGMPVDASGIAMSDEDIYQRYLMWHDSIPWVTENWVEDYAKLESDPGHWSNKYSVKVSSNENGLAQSEINLLLSYKDIKSWQQGDEKVYLVGAYDRLADAVKHKVELSNQGIQGNVIKEDSGRLIDMSAQAESIETQMASSGEAMFNNSREVMYRVQVGAFKHDLTRNVFGGIIDLVVMNGNDGLTRYMTRSYSDEGSAAKRKVDLLMAGFDGAFITAYQGGQRITLSDAGMKVKSGAQDLTYDVENHSINSEDIMFKVKLGSFDDRISTETLDKFLALGNVNPIRVGNQTIYVQGSFNSPEEAEGALENARSHGFNEATVVGDFNGKIISAEEAKLLKDYKGEVISSN